MNSYEISDFVDWRGLEGKEASTELGRFWAGSANRRVRTEVDKGLAWCHIPPYKSTVIIENPNKSMILNIRH